MPTLVRCLIAVPRNGSTPEVRSGQEVVFDDRVADAWIAAGRAELIERRAEQPAADEATEPSETEGETSVAVEAPVAAVKPRRKSPVKRATSRRVTTRRTRRAK